MRMMGLLGDWKMKKFNMTSKENLVRRFRESMGKSKLLVLRGNYIPLFLLTDWLKFYDENFEKKRNLYPVLTLRKEGIFTHYINLDEYLDVSREGIQRYINDPKFMENINLRYAKVMEKINKIYRNYMLAELTEEKYLLKNLKEAEKNLHEVVAVTLFMDFLDSKTLEETYGKKGIGLDFEKIYEVSNIYDFQSFDVKNNLEILKWHGKNKRYLRHVFTGYSLAATTKDVEKKISKLNLGELKKEAQKFKSSLEDKRKEKEKLRNGLSLGEREVSDFLSWISKLRDDRKTLMNKLDVIFYDTTFKLYSLWGIDSDLAKDSYVFEVLKGKEWVLDNIEKVKSRKNTFINLYFGGEKYLEKYDKLEEEFGEAELLEEPRKDVREIKGQTANKGVVRGFAKIIYDPKKGHSFMEGEILVTGMTRPEFVPLMKKASAIVTNEGGITCHAAIISRELNKPCIIGTKNATEILRDGDLVEVDGETGVIRKLRYQNEV